MTFNKDDFNRCLYNPLETGFYKKYPDLKLLWPEGEQKMRYIAALYDPNSPLGKHIPDLNVRKQKAAELVGFDLKNEQVLTAMYDFTDERFLTAVDGFLKTVNNMKWAMIVSMQQIWWEWNARMMKPVSSDKGDKDELQAIEIKARVRDEMAKTETLIGQYYQQFYFGDDKLVETVKKKRITPEMMANNV